MVFCCNSLREIELSRSHKLLRYLQWPESKPLFYPVKEAVR